MNLFRVHLGGLLLQSGVLAVALMAGACTMSEVRKGDRLAAQGNWDGAVAAYREALKKRRFDEALQQRLDRAKARAAERHYAEGRNHLQEHRVQEALEEFKLAVGLDPSRSEHHAGMGDVLRLKEARDHLATADKLHHLGRLDEALQTYERAAELDPTLGRALEGITAVTEKQRADRALGGSSQPISLRFQNARPKEVFEVLARAGGLNVVFDKEVRDDPITIFIKDMPFYEALNLILSTNGLFARRIGPDTLLIIPNTKQKQEQYQDLMIRTFYLSNAKAKDTLTLLRTMLESKRVYVNEQLNAVVIRDTPEKLHLAERIILTNDRREAEVEFDVEVLEVNRTKSQQLGLTFPTSAGLGAMPPGATALSSAAATFTYRQLTGLGPDSYLFSLPASVQLDFFKQESDAKILASPKLRVLSGKQASVNVGDKQPILLSTTNVLPGQAATGAVPTTSTVTSIEFKDVGVKLTVEPTIHLVDELTLKLKIEVSRLGDQVTLQASPLIKQYKFGTRTAETILNMKDGETVILAGLIQDEDQKTRVTIPWLGDIPILGHLFSSTQDSTVTTEVMLTITPHLVRNLNAPGLESQAFWSGTELNYATGPLFSVQGWPSPVDETAQHAANISRGVADAANTAATDAAGRDTPLGRDSSGFPVQTDGTILLEIRPPELIAVVGQEVRVDLWGEHRGPAAEASVAIGYDPQVLEFRQAVEGEILKQPGAAVVFTQLDDSPPGQVVLQFRQPERTSPAKGVLATLVFLARAPGTAAVAAKQVPTSAVESDRGPVSPRQTVVRVIPDVSRG